MTCEPGRTCTPLGVVEPMTKRIQAQLQYGYDSPFIQGAFVCLDPNIIGGRTLCLFSQHIPYIHITLAFHVEQAMWLTDEVILNEFKSCF